MRRPSSSSIRVSAANRKRVGDLTVKLKAASQQEVIDRALDKLEHSLLWEGFDEEAHAYLAAYAMEREERDRFAATCGLVDGIDARLDALLTATVLLVEELA